MPAVATQVAEKDVRAFVEGFLASWTGTDENQILAYYSDDIVLHTPAGTLKGKAEVRDNFVRPFITAFPGNVKVMVNIAYGKNLVAVEWSFEGVHTGPFGNIAATGSRVQLPGCSFYTYDFAIKVITVARTCFDVGTLLRQIGAAA
jgi:predicted ester cyclase